MTHRSNQYNIYKKRDLALDYKSLDKIRISASITNNISKYHGIICSRLCFGIKEFNDLMSKDSNANHQIVSIQLKEFNAALFEIIEEQENQFKSNVLDFQPLLPDESEPIEVRALALALWSEGFIDSCGMCIAELDLDIEGIGNGEVSEIIEDFSQISTLDPNSILEEEEEEIALMELVEYVRVSVQLFFENLRGQTNES
jgi:hypothetical protein